MDEILLTGARQGLVNMLGLKEGDKFTMVTDAKTAGETDNAFVAVATEVVGSEMSSSTTCCCYDNGFSHSFQLRA